jgi:hypothetical protein
VAEFDEIAGLDAAAADDELDDDEDLVVLGGAEKNEKCPYTMKLVSYCVLLAQQVCNSHSRTTSHMCAQKNENWAPPAVAAMPCVVCCCCCIVCHAYLTCGLFCLTALLFVLVQLIDLDDPVEDQKGFVYEGAAIRADITRNRGRIECPMAGASHWVTAADLKPCKRILRLQKHRQRHPGAGQQQQTQAPRAAGGRVLDI